MVMMKSSRLTFRAMRDRNPQALRSTLKTSLVCSYMSEMGVTDRFVSAKLTKEWTSPVYAFFQPTPNIGYEDGRRYHSFKCAGKSCTKTICRYLDKKDAKSTSNLRKHAKSCWGEAAVRAVDQAKNATEARDKIVVILWNGFHCIYMEF
jgi:hypothetical protein